MYLINIHCKPTSENAEYFGKIKGGYASFYFDYKDLNGAFELARFYVQKDFGKLLK
jgi:hypothetical protein